MDTTSMPLLLVNKKDNTCSRLMELVKNCLPGKIFKPKSFMVDFELGLSNLLEKACPTTKLSFCFFSLMSVNVAKCTRQRAFNRISR